MRSSMTIILVSILVATTWAQSMEELSEEGVKSAFIYHFINYTEWNDQSDRFRVCIPEDLIFRLRARRILEGKRIKKRFIEVTDEEDNCHVLVKNDPPWKEEVLLIGTLSRGAQIEFRNIDNKLKFAINPSKINLSKLKISSQLLKLAIIDE